MLCHPTLGSILLGSLAFMPTAQAQKPLTAIAVDEEKDGLPGAAVGPSRKDIEDLIRVIGREPTSQELIDRIDALFRPRWGSRVKFNGVRLRCVDPFYLARIDAISRDLIKKPADTRVVVQNALVPRQIDDTILRSEMKQDFASEIGPRLTLKGRIIDDVTSRPIQNAVVVSQTGMLTRTDSKGNYLLKTRAPQVSAFYLTIEAPGFALTTSILDVTKMSEPEVSDYRLVRAIPFGGRVIDSEGKPIAGAEVELSMHSSAVIFGGTPAQRNTHESPLYACSDKDGVYAFRNLPPDSGPQNLAFSLTVTHPKYQMKLKRYAQNELLGDGWEIRMEPGATIRGVLIDEAGKPVAGAIVRTQSGHTGMAITDEHGKFRFDNLRAGDVQVLVRPLAHAHAFATVKAEMGEPNETKIVAANGEYFEGKVVDEDGKPVAGAYVGNHVRLNVKDKDGTENIRISMEGTLSRDDGSFRYGPLAKGRYRIRADHRGPEFSLAGAVDAESGAKDLIIKIISSR